MIALPVISLFKEMRPMTESEVQELVLEYFSNNPIAPGAIKSIMRIDPAFTFLSFVGHWCVNYEFEGEEAKYSSVPSVNIYVNDSTGEVATLHELFRRADAERNWNSDQVPVPPENSQ